MCFFFHLMVINYLFTGFLMGFYWALVGFHYEKLGDNMIDHCWLVDEYYPVVNRGSRGAWPHR